jgi:hypothetical protein
MAVKEGDYPKNWEYYDAEKWNLETLPHEKLLAAKIKCALKISQC